MKNVVCWLKGRLGNQMFCIASSYYFCEKLGANFVGAFNFEKDKTLQNENESSEYIKKKIFKDVKYLDPNEYLNKSEWIVYPTTINTYLTKDFKIPNEDNIILNDFFQDASLIKKDIALKLFKPYDSIKEEIKDIYGDLSDYACLHVRRTDYANNIHLGFKMLNKDIIERIIKEHFPNTKIMVVSDDINWCKQNLIGNNYYFVDKPCNNNLEMDLYIQTQCGKGNIISNSTFSWWGAFLNENPNAKVIVRTPWFDKNFLGGGNKIIPNNWIKVEY